jgi:hypothetical protein
VQLCAELRVDRMVLRPLNHSDSLLDSTRAGHHFNYQKELLPFDELVRASGRAAELCRRFGVELTDQMDFGGSAMGAQFDVWFEEGRRAVSDAANAGAAASPVEQTPPEQGPEAGPAEDSPAMPLLPRAEPLPSLGGERKPLCTEPWKSLYILRRGVFPCCYGDKRLGDMDQYREAWNSPQLQQIRTALAEGRFPSYCLDSSLCPIVQKMQHAAAPVSTEPPSAPQLSPELVAEPPSTPEPSPEVPQGDTVPAGMFGRAWALLASFRGEAKPRCETN